MTLVSHPPLPPPPLPLPPLPPPPPLLPLPPTPISPTLLLPPPYRRIDSHHYLPPTQLPPRNPPRDIVTHAPQVCVPYAQKGNSTAALPPLSSLFLSSRISTQLVNLPLTYPLNPPSPPTLSTHLNLSTHPLTPSHPTLSTHTHPLNRCSRGDADALDAGLLFPLFSRLVLYRDHTYCSSTFS